MTQKWTIALCLFILVLLSLGLYAALLSLTPPERAGREQLHAAISPTDADDASTQAQSRPVGDAPVGEALEVQGRFAGETDDTTAEADLAAATGEIASVTGPGAAGAAGTAITDATAAGLPGAEVATGEIDDATGTAHDDDRHADAGEQDDSDRDGLEPDEVEAELTPPPQEGAVVTGRVVGRQTGAGVPEMAVLITDAARRGVSMRTFSDAGGGFMFLGLTEGFYILSAPGNQRGVQVALAALDETFVELPVDEGAEIYGQVSDEQDHPVADALVMLYRASNRELLSETASGADGSYMLPNALAGVDLEVRAELPGLAADSRRVLLSGLTPLFDVNLKLVIGARLSGEVQDRNGNPLAGATVRAEHIDGAVSPQEVRCNDQGAFAMDNLSAGAWRVVASHSGYAPEDRSVTLNSQNPNQNLVFRLHGGRAVAGRAVAFGSLQPLSGIEVTLTYYGFRDTQLTGADGRFRFDAVSLAEGANAQVFGKHDNYSSTYISVEPGDENIELIMRAMNTLVLRVLNPDGGIVNSYRVSFLPHSTPDEQFREFLYTGLEVQTDDTASWRLPPSTYRVTITAPGMVQQDFDMVGGWDIAHGSGITVGPVVLRMQAWGLTVSGVVQGEGGGVGGALVSGFSGDVRVGPTGELQQMGGPTAMAQTNSAGEFTLQGCPPGTMILTASAHGYDLPSPITVTVPVEGLAGARITLPRGGE